MSHQFPFAFLTGQGYIRTYSQIHHYLPHFPLLRLPVKLRGFEGSREKVLPRLTFSSFDFHSLTFAGL